jgi:transposase
MTSSLMLLVNLPGVAVMRTEDGPSLEVHAECEGRPVACLLCGAARVIGHGVLQQVITDLPIRGKAVGIHLARKRWRCPTCGGTFLHPLDWIDDDHRTTRRFVDHVASLSLGRSFSALAREYGVHEKTVRSIFYGRYAPVIVQQRFTTPECLGLDEIKIAGGLRGMVTNVFERSGLEFLPESTSVAFAAYFERMPDRGNVKTLVMGCVPHYRALAQTFFPRASVVVDKSCVLRAVDLVVDEARLAIRGSFTTRRGKLKLKRDRDILKTRERNLSDLSREQLDNWRREVPQLAALYDIKEGFYEIYGAESAQEARARFDAWCRRIPREAGQLWAPILAAWGDWESEILAYWSHPLVSVYTECKSMLTQAVENLGHGYSFDASRVKLLLAPKRCGALEEILQTGHRDVAFGIDLARLGQWLAAQGNAPCGNGARPE